MSTSGEARAIAKRRFEAVVRGVVQGVGFRYFVMRRANRLGLGGWVANEPNGTVRCVAEGPSDVLEELLDVIRRGPPGSRVDGVDVSWSPPGAGFDGFSVRPTGHSGD